MGRIVKLKQEATRIAPNRDDLLAEYYRYIYDRAHTFTRPVVSRQLLGETSRKLELDPQNIVAKKFRGIAQVLSLSNDVTLEDQQRAKADLEAALAADPEDRLARHHLAMWHVYQAQRVRGQSPLAGGDPRANLSDEARSHTEAALALSNANHQAYGSDPEALADHLRVLLNPLVGQTQQARAVIDQLEQAILENPVVDTRLVSALTDFIISTQRDRVEEANGIGGVKPTEGLIRVEDLLTRLTEVRPDNVVLQAMLARVLRLQMKLPEAMERYRAADTVVSVGPPSDMIQIDQLQQEVRYEIANLELVAAEQATDPQERAARLDAADAALEELRRISEADPAAVDLLQGKIALLRGNNSQAVKSLGNAAELYRQSNTANLEAMRLAARAYQLERQWGAAARELEYIVSNFDLSISVPVETRLRLELAETYANMQRVDAAEAQHKRLLEIAADDPAVQRIGVLVAARSGDLDAARSRLDTVLAQDPDRPIAVQMVRLVFHAMRDAGELEDGAELLRSFLDRYPGDAVTLADLITLAGAGVVPAAEIEQRLAAAAEAGTSDEDLAALRMAASSASDGQAMPRAQMAAAIAPEATDLASAVRRYRIFQQVGLEEEAEAAYEAALGFDPDHPDVVLLGVSRAAAAGDFETASRLADEAAARDLDLAGGDLVRGQLAAAQNKTDEAITFFRSGLNKRPVYDEGHKALGDLYLRVGDVRQAVASYRTAVEQRPDNAVALIALARALLQQEQIQPALDAARQAIASGAGNPLILEAYVGIEGRFGEVDRVIQVRERVAARSPQDHVNRLTLALLYARQGDVGRAEQALEAAEQAGAPALAIVTARAGISDITGDIEQGLTAFDTYLSNAPDDAAGQLAYAGYLAQIGRPSSAIDRFQRAVDLGYEGGRPAGRRLGDTLFNNGAFAEAAKVYEVEASALEGSDQQEATVALRSRQAEALLYSGGTDGARAVVQQLPEQPTTLLLSALVADADGDREQAIRITRDLIERFPEGARGYVQLGRLLLGRDDAGALEAADAAIERDEDLVMGYRIRGQALQQLGQASAAVDTFEELVRRQPNNLEARVTLADLYLRQGRVRPAQRVVSEGLRRTPDAPVLLELDGRIAKQSGSTREAISKLQKAVDAQATPQTVSLLVDTQLAADRPDAALGTLDRHADLVGRNVFLQAMRARALRESGDTEAADRVFKLAAGRIQDASQLTPLVVSLYEANPDEQAGRALVRDELRPELRAEFDIVWAQFLVSRGQAEAGRDLLLSLERELDSRGDASPELVGKLQQSLGTTLLTLNDYEGADRAYEQAQALLPNSVNVLNNHAFLLAKHLGQPDRALPLAERAVDLAPLNASILDTLGVVYQLQGDHERARSTFEEALKLGNVAATHLHLAETLIELGETTQARIQLDEALNQADETGDEATEAAARDLLMNL